MCSEAAELRWVCQEAKDLTVRTYDVSCVNFQVPRQHGQFGLRDASFAASS